MYLRKLRKYKEKLLLETFSKLVQEEEDVRNKILGSLDFLAIKKSKHDTLVTITNRVGTKTIAVEIKEVNKYLTNHIDVVVELIIVLNCGLAGSWGNSGF